MNLTTALEAFFASDTGRYAALVLILPVIDWTLGTLAAIRDGTFQLDSLLAFVRKQIAGRPGEPQTLLNRDPVQPVPHE
jgi:hypothetical protein